MSFVGMVIEEVEQLASHLESKAEEIESGVVAALSSAVAGAAWVGADRDLFENEWHSQHVPALQVVVQTLREGAARARQNAQQQRQASAG